MMASKSSGTTELLPVSAAHLAHETNVSGMEAQSNDRDANELARLGKKQVLKRNFAFTSMLGFSCTMMLTWEGILVLFVFGFTNGGPAGLVYGFLIDWIGALAVFTVMAEMASMAPTAGGQYHWVSMLAPPSSRNFFSYMTGWLTITGWQALVASGGYLGGTTIQGMITMNDPEYIPERWHGTLLFWAVVVFAVFMNTVASSLLPKFEGLILIFHVLGFFAILIPLVYMAPHGAATDVYTLFLNEGGWPTQGLSFFVGLVGNVFAFLGADGAVHMAEEISNASKIVPRVMMTSILLNGTLGFAMLTAVLFCLEDIQAILETPTGYSFMEIFLQATGRSVSGSTIMAAIITSLGTFSVIGFIATSSRSIWAFARDRGLPFWPYLSRVDSRTSIPLISVTVTTIIACLLGFINIGSTMAFQVITSLTINGLYSSYLLCCSLLLYRRMTNSISISPPSSPDSTKIETNTNPSNLVWGPFRIPGILGIAVNLWACVYMIVILFFSFWPSATPTTPQTMNYSVLMTGSVVLFSTVYYFAWARKVYTGPIVERECWGMVH